MIYIKDKNKVEEIQNNINKYNITMFMDFDRTMTTPESDDSWDASAKKNGLSTKLEEFYDKYRPIELDYTLSKKEKEKYMLEWYQGCMDLYYEFKITKEDLEKSIKNSKIILRNGLAELLCNLHKNKVPVIILSAGIGNVIEQTLKEENCYYNNITIISNFFKFNDQGQILKYNDYLIHTLNKNIDKVADVKIKSIINERKYKVIVGDLIEDINMIGRYQENRVLKIGFLNSNIEKNKEIYKEKFDIVLSEKNDFVDIQEYLKEIL